MSKTVEIIFDNHIFWMLLTVFVQKCINLHFWLEIVNFNQKRSIKTNYGPEKRFLSLFLGPLDLYDLDRTWFTLNVYIFIINTLRKYHGGPYLHYKNCILNTLRWRYWAIEQNLLEFQSILLSIPSSRLSSL